MKLHGLGKAHHNWLGDFLGKGAKEVESVCHKAGSAIKANAASVGETVAHVAGNVAGAKVLKETAFKTAGGFAEELKAGSKASTLATALVEAGVDIGKDAKGKMTVGQAITDEGEKTGIAAIGNEVNRVVEKNFLHNKFRSLDDPLQKIKSKVTKPLDEAKSKVTKGLKEGVEKVKTKIKGGENDIKNVNELMEEDLEGLGEQAAKLGTKEGIEAAGEDGVEEVGEIGLPTLLVDSGDVALTAELVKTGAEGGSVVLGAGTIIGAAVGLAVGIGVSVGMSELAKTKEGQKINKAVSDKLDEAGSKAKSELSKLGKKLKHKH